MVPKSNPYTITVASGRCTSLPSPVASMAGVRPKAATVAKAQTPAAIVPAAGPGAGHMPRQSFEVLSSVGAMFKTIEAPRRAGQPLQVGIREVSSGPEQRTLR